MKVQAGLAASQQSHTRFINQGVKVGLKVHVLVNRALMEQWIFRFVQFIDDYYRELLNAQFGPTKAWHITT
jgi:hypothetical protein